MSYRNTVNVLRLVKFGAVGGIIAGGASLTEPNKQVEKFSMKFSVSAKSEDFDRSRGDLYQGMGTKWDNNWDKRY